MEAADWVSLSDEQLVERRISKLGLRLEGTTLESLIKQMEAAQKTKPVRLMLADVNDPARVLSDHQNFYYALLSLGNEKEQPGAELNAAWYQRNAKIFAKLTQIAQPGDRILVVFGSGHAFWLRHFVQNTPGFQLIEPRAYLQ